MREFQERRRVKKLLHSRYSIAVLAILCLFLVHAVWNSYGKYQKSKDIVSRMEADLAALEAREASLSGSIDALGTPEGREREIRDRFDVTKEGEKVIVFIDGTGTRDRIQQSVPESGWSRFWGMFGF